MQLDSTMISEVRECLASSNASALRELKPKSLSIGAAVELACLQSVCPDRFRELFDCWREASPILRDAFLAFDSATYPSQSNLWIPRRLEFFPIRGRQWAEAQRYHPFESRFRKAAREAGFGDRADGLTGAMFEMADNVAQHSGANSESPAPGMIGYYVCNGHVGFAIGDLGRGVISSLRENPEWGAIPDSKSALLAVLEKHASRRPHGGDGEGFKQVFRSLADLNGLVNLSSQDGLVRLVRTEEGREAISHFTGFLAGFQLSVNCSLIGPPREEIFAVDYLT